MLGCFELLHTGVYNTCCLTRTNILRLGTVRFLLTASTDGHIVVWPLSEAQETNNTIGHTTSHEDFPSQTPLIWTKRYRIHQSSIKCIEILELSKQDSIVVTGGDDNSIAFTRVTGNTKEPYYPIFVSVRIPRAHASTITSIRFISHTVSKDRRFATGPYRIVTSSNDQRLKTWLLSVDTTQPGIDGLSVTRQENIYSEVADASCMATIPRGANGATLVVAGVGLEMWKIIDH